MKAVLFFIVSALALSLSTANATSIRQENGILLSGMSGKLGWTKKYITVDKEAANALFDLLSKTSAVKTDGEDGLWNYTVSVDKISCRREQNLIIENGPEEYHVATTCTLEIPYGIVAYLQKSESDPEHLVIETSSAELVKALQTNPDTKVENNGQGHKYDYADSAIRCEVGGLTVCYLTESVK